MEALLSMILPTALPVSINIRKKPYRRFISMNSCIRAAAAVESERL